MSHMSPENSCLFAARILSEVDGAGFFLAFEGELDIGFCLQAGGANRIERGHQRQ